jgi:hypothetical protein
VASSQPDALGQRPVSRTPPGTASARPPAGLPEPQNSVSGCANSSRSTAGANVPTANAFEVTHVPATHAVDGQSRPSALSRRAISVALAHEPPYSRGVRRAKAPTSRATCRLSAVGRPCTSVFSAFAASISFTGPTPAAGAADRHARAAQLDTRGYHRWRWT